MLGIQDIFKFYVMLLKSVQEWRVLSLQFFIIIAHKYDASEILMDNASGVQQSP